MLRSPPPDFGRGREPVLGAGGGEGFDTLTGATTRGDADADSESEYGSAEDDEMHHRR